MWLRLERLQEDSDGLHLALGRALAVAQNYEHNARFVLQIVRVGKEYKKRGEVEALDELIEYVNNLPREMLGRLVRGFDQLGGIAASKIDTLRRGVDARNYIAHEAAAGLSYDGPKGIAERMQKLDDAVRDLVEADNLMSCWSYEIQEKAPAPLTIRLSYPVNARQWVMGSWFESEEVHDDP